MDHYIPSTKSINDDDIKKAVEKVQAGDSSAFNQLIECFYHKIHSRIEKRVQLSHAADDLTQETFTNAYCFMKSYDDTKGRFYTWLVCIADNQVRNYWRQRFGSKECPFALDVPCPETNSLMGDPELAKYALSLLSDSDQRIINDRVILGETVKEIANKLGISEEAAKKRCCRAIKRLVNAYGARS